MDHRVAIGVPADYADDYFRIVADNAALDESLARLRSSMESLAIIDRLNAKERGRLKYQLRYVRRGIRMARQGR